MEARAGPVTSYSDYMRCLAAKYNNNQASTPTPLSPPAPPHPTIKVSRRNVYHQEPTPHFDILME